MTKKLYIVLTALLLAFTLSSRAYYDPSTRTFLSRDPARETGGANLYAYCNNQPFGNWDPIGLAAVLIIRTPDEYARVQRDINNGVTLFNGVKIYKGFQNDGGANGIWALAQRINGFKDPQTGHAYSAGVIRGVNGTWFFDNQEHFRSIKQDVDANYWIIVGFQVGSIALASGTSGLAEMPTMATLPLPSAYSGPRITTTFAAPKPITENVSTQAYIDSLRTKFTPTNSAADLFEIEYTGPLNYQLTGGGETLWADGFENTTILESKYIYDVSRSPSIPGSNVPPFLRSKINAEVSDEIRRAGAIINDLSNPFTNLRIITNEPSANPFFENLLNHHGVPGEVVNP